MTQKEPKWEDNENEDEHEDEEVEFTLYVCSEAHAGRWALPADVRL